MSFSEFVTSSGHSIDESRTSLALIAMQYATHLNMPNICSVSSAVFTHGDLRFDPENAFNRRLFNDPKSIVKIFPEVAKSHAQAYDSAWFTENMSERLLAMLSGSTHAWLLFSVNPDLYSGMNGHQVGLSNVSDGYYDVWDTTMQYPNAIMNESEVWKMCRDHMYGERPIIMTFKD